MSKHTKDGRKIDDRDRVIYTGSSSEQRTFGRYTGDWNLLQVGKEYTVVDKKVHDWHTEIMLRGVRGSFNSVCFIEADHE